MKSKPTKAKAPSARRISRKVRAAIDLRVWSGKLRAEAATEAGLLASENVDAFVALRSFPSGNSSQKWSGFANSDQPHDPVCSFVLFLTTMAKFFQLMICPAALSPQLNTRQMLPSSSPLRKRDRGLKCADPPALFRRKRLHETTHLMEISLTALPLLLKLVLLPTNISSTGSDCKSGIFFEGELRRYSNSVVEPRDLCNRFDLSAVPWFCRAHGRRMRYSGFTHLPLC